jgi:uncharacterized protein (DUF924 family)
MSQIHVDLEEVLAFWFEELKGEEDWFNASAELDARIRERFADVHRAVAAGEYWRERTNARAYLAEVLVLDQFSRQMFRGQAAAFAWDGQALVLAQHAIAASYETTLSQHERLFLFLPFMHSESRAIHEDAVPLFESLGHEESLKYEHVHKDIIERFGRYPHRNEQLGRESTEAELEYLREHDHPFFAS